MYKKEETELRAKLEQMQSNGADAHALKKHKEFVDETTATVKDILKRVEKAVVDLEATLKDYSKKDDKVATDAAEILAQTQKELSSAPKGDGSGNLSAGTLERPVVVVFGSSTARKGDKVWKISEQLGRLLGSSGFNLVNGGYGGTMEAVAMGVKQSETQGAAVEGVICPSAFPSRGMHGNSFLSKETKTASISQRLSKLVSSSNKFVILPGALGTLMEFIYVWNLSQMGPTEAKGLTIIAFRDPWQKVCLDLSHTLSMPENVLSTLKFVDTAEEAVAILSAA
eukprot:gb/GEZN01013890.1/.p1 GENE.gb/GEZN01013890.1/~~gb/GEZN01013890.1/.p1  ORF type:complete len:305 (-),score=47.13 gb/GEZN01013890.1/:71-919(-)